MSEKRTEEIIADLYKKISTLTQNLFSASAEEQAQIKDEISRISERIRTAAQEAARAAAEAVRGTDRDDFWDLGAPKARVYKKPDFEGHTVDTTVVRSENEYDASKAAASEKIPPRSSYREDERTKRTVTSSYRRNVPVSRNFVSFGGNTVKNESKLIREYSPGGALIGKVTVRTWESGTEFYSRFTSDALSSHNAPCRVDPDTEMSPVPFMSYVPQYAHMSSRQMEYYRWLRENIRLGRYPDCDLGYIQLYIYEIFNLPGEIPPEIGADIVASIWLAYRERQPRLDGYLCEWLADYCMINKCSLPRSLDVILPIITPKAQFKEFYLDPLVTGALSTPDDSVLTSLGKTVMEVSSDYDYTASRYYTDNREAYDTHIPLAVGKAIRAELTAKNQPFSLDRIYKMTRDSYCGAIVSSGIKKRVDIEFSSFTRRADVRGEITAMVKHSENKVRVLLGIKSKLRADDVAKTSEAAIDEYFRPLIPVTAAVNREDMYMPRDYLKLYESEDSGFDLSKAAEIERQSWVNTERLTGEEYIEKAEEYIPDIEVQIEGEMTDTESFPAETIISADEPTSDITSEPVTAPATDDIITGGVASALRGRFREYCRENGLYDGEAADRINTLFLDIIGDILLEDPGNGYRIIEDYREDAENWLQMQ